ncbi:MAG: hypothetical protein KGM43_19015 [Planctomycetota bacterium]|nr:hypothetical protein [Planctomycetota bacterium]
MRATDDLIAEYAARGASGLTVRGAGGDAVAVEEVLGRLEGGAGPAEASRALGLDAVGLAAAIAADALGWEGELGPPLVRARGRRARLAEALDEARWAEVAPGSSRPARLSLCAGLLQIQDHWDASHEAAQEADDLGERDFASYWHAIAHRREPDPGNAGYWIRRVGRHALYPRLAAASRPLLREYPRVEDAEALVAGGTWNASAFVALCGRARPGGELETLARRLQRLEMTMLLTSTARAAFASA